MGRVPLFSAATLERAVCEDEWGELLADQGDSGAAEARTEPQRQTTCLTQPE